MPRKKCSENVLTWKLGVVRLEVMAVYSLFIPFVFHNDSDWLLLGGRQLPLKKGKLTAKPQSFGGSWIQLLDLNLCLCPFPCLSPWSVWPTDPEDTQLPESCLREICVFFSHKRKFQVVGEGREDKLIKRKLLRKKSFPPPFVHPTPWPSPC